LNQNLYAENSSHYESKALPLALQRALHVKPFETHL